MSAAAPPVQGSADIARPSTAAAWITLAALLLAAGMVTTLKDVLVAHLKTVFSLDYASAMEIPFFFFTSCLVFSIPFGKMMDRIGYRWSLVYGLLITAFGAALLIPAAMVASYPFFLFAIVVQGIGMTLLQVSANPLIAQMGPEQTASSRLNLFQAFNSVGTVIGPKFGGLLILGAAPVAASAMLGLNSTQMHAYQVRLASTVKLPYLISTLLLAAIAVMIAVVRLNTRGDVGQPRSERTSLLQLASHRQLVQAAIAMFLYVGAEVTIGSFMVNYLSQPEIGGISEKTAAGFVSFYWGGAMVGRFIGSAAQQKIRPRMVLAFNAVVAAALVSTSMLTFGGVAMWSMIAVGLFNSIMFPTIFALGIEGLGSLTAYGAGVLSAAVVGGAVVPELQGLLADRVGIHHAFLLAVACYAYIFYFALWGSSRRVQASQA